MGTLLGAHGGHGGTPRLVLFLAAFTMPSLLEIESGLVPAWWCVQEMLCRRPVWPGVYLAMSFADQRSAKLIAKGEGDRGGSQELTGLRCYRF